MFDISKVVIKHKVLKKVNSSLYVRWVNGTFWIINVFIILDTFKIISLVQNNFIMIRNSSGYLASNIREGSVLEWKGH